MAYLSRTTTAFLPPVQFLHPTTAAAASIVPLSETESLLPSLPLQTAPSSIQFAPTLSSSTQLIAAPATADVLASSPQSAQVFQAVAPDTSLLVGFASVVLLCVAAGVVWANDVVPVSRTKLAISKSRGQVREYLDDLKIDDDTSFNDRHATDSEPQESLGADLQPNDTVDDGRGFERWLFADWLDDKPGNSGGRKKEPALPILKKAKWNSGDNPVLVTAAIMMLGVIVASVAERIAT